MEDERASSLVVDSWDRRLSVIESSIIELQKAVAETTKNLSVTTEAVRMVAESLKSVSDTQNAALKTNLGAVFAGITATIGVIGLVIYTPLNSLVTRYQVHVQDGHPNSVMEIINVERRHTASELQRNEIELTKIQERLDDTDRLGGKLEERLRGVEQQVYSGTGLPTKSDD